MQTAVKPKHDVEDLIRIFNDLFKEKYNTILVRGDDEPIYLPADDHHPHNRLIFAHGYFSSALHEIAHWCIAGKRRRKLVDFGYWYQPDGRTTEQQEQFMKVEIKPQALEWVFSVVADHKFTFSADNLTGEATDMTTFKESVHQQVLTWLDTSFPTRALSLIHALKASYEPDHELRPQSFSLRT